MVTFENPDALSGYPFWKIDSPNALGGDLFSKTDPFGEGEAVFENGSADALGGDHFRKWVPSVRARPFLKMGPQTRWAGPIFENGSLG